jgi:hypothetical protein
MCRMPCVFCLRHGPLSEEHVIPKWAQQYVKDPQNGPGTHTRRLYEPGQPEAVFSRSYVGFPATQVTRCVCQQCNSGWMGSLEGTAKPLLVPMIQGRPTILDTTAQALIASWLIKTALVGGSTLPEPMPSEFYTSFLAIRLQRRRPGRGSPALHTSNTINWTCVGSGPTGLTIRHRPRRTRIARWWRSANGLGS